MMFNLFKCAEWLQFLNISICVDIYLFEIEMNINFSSFVIESTTKTSYLRSFHIVNFSWP